MRADLKTIGDAVIAAVKSHVARATEALTARLDAFERRMEAISEGRLESMSLLVDAAVAKAVAAMPAPRDGKDADLDAVRAMVDEAVARAAAEIPVPADGKDADPETVAAMVRDAAAAIQPIDYTAIDERLRDMVARAFAEMPAPRDGKSVTLDDVRPVLDIAIAQLRADADAVFKESLMHAESAREALFKALGELRQPEDGKSVTLDDVRPVLESKQAEWALDFERRAQDLLQRAIDRIPMPKDGRDALDIDDLEVEQDDDGRVTLRFVRGDVRKEFALRFPVFVDRGVFREGERYERGNGVTWGGSFWIAQKDAPEGKPGESPDFRLAVKKGRDGRDGEKSEAVATGKKGAA